MKSKRFAKRLKETFLCGFRYGNGNQFNSTKSSWLHSPTKSKSV